MTITDVRREQAGPTRVSGGFRKVRFTSPTGQTAGLILDSERLRTMTVSEVSRMFPVSEFRSMLRFQQSPTFATYDEAFAYEF